LSNIAKPASSTASPIGNSDQPGKKSLPRSTAHPKALSVAEVIPGDVPMSRLSNTPPSSRK
jgi:hypothetical protein